MENWNAALKNSIGKICIRIINTVNRVSCPMLTSVPKSCYFLDYLNFGTLFDFLGGQFGVISPYIKEGWSCQII